MDKYDYRDIGFLMNRLYSIDVKDINYEATKISVQIEEHRRGAGFFHSEGELSMAILSVEILRKRRREIALLNRELTKNGEIPAIKPYNRDILIQEYADKIIDEVFNNINNGMNYKLDTFNNALSLGAYLYCYRDYGEGFKKEVKDAINKNEDVIAFREKLEEELREEQAMKM